MLEQEGWLRAGGLPLDQRKGRRGMVKYVAAREEHPVRDMEIKHPVEAVCQSVRAVPERTVSFRKVRPAAVEVPEYQPVKQIQGVGLLPESANIQKQNGLAPQQPERMASRELVFDVRRSKRVNDNLTLRELFSEQEGY